MKPALKAETPEPIAVHVETSRAFKDSLILEHAPVQDAELLRPVELLTGYDDTIRWPSWKSGALVIGLCLGFWVSAAAGLIYILG